MNNQEIFTPEEQNENEQRKRKLIELVASGEAVLIVGAGSSKRMGYPDWYGLLAELEKLAKKGRGTNQFFEGMQNYLIRTFTNIGQFLKKRIMLHDKKNRIPNAIKESIVGFERKKVKPELDLLEYASNLKLNICKQKDGERKYNELLERLFDDEFDDEFKEFRCDDFHKTLVSLPFRGILTTNYDMVLEAALDSIGQSPAYNNSLVIKRGSTGQVDKFIRGLSDQNISRRIAHLHGRYDFPESIILTSEDYKETYDFVVTKETSELKLSRKLSLLNPLNSDQGVEGNSVNLHQMLLSAVFTTRRVVFVGFSMKDPYLNKILETVTKNLGRQGKPIHYVIMSIASKNSKDSIENAKILQEKYGVVTVFYEKINDSHYRLERLIDEIDESCKGKKKKISINDQRDQMNQTNRRMVGRMTSEDI